MNPEVLCSQVVSVLGLTLLRPLLSPSERTVLTGLRGFVATAPTEELSRLSGFLPAYFDQEPK